MTPFAIAVHGGAGPRGPAEGDAEALAGLTAAVEAGRAVLVDAGGALDAVVAAVCVLEDHPRFNAGRGSVLAEDGTVRMDAAVMAGAGRRLGAVTGAHGVRNPVLLARAVLDEGRHGLLAFEGAAELVRQEWRVPGDWHVTESRRARWAAGVDAVPAVGTVGAVARDARGGLAAATSTGGTPRKRIGRIGDSPLPGAGTWADDATCAVSCTGDGEAIMRAALAHEVDALVRLGGLPLAAAAERAVHEALAALEGDGGLIALGPAGPPATPFRSQAMARAWCEGGAPVKAALT